MHYEDWWCKKSATPPALRSLLPTDQALQMNIKLSHHVAIMWENCVIGNPPELNPCEYGWERNEGEKSLRSTIPTNTPRGFHVEMTWKRSFPRRFNVESTWCVCRVYWKLCQNTLFLVIRLVSQKSKTSLISKNNDPLWII